MDSSRISTKANIPYEVILNVTLEKTQIKCSIHGEKDAVKIGDNLVCVDCLISIFVKSIGGRLNGNPIKP